MRTVEVRRARWSALAAVIAVGVALVVPVLVAVADDESDLVRAIEDELGNVRGYLDGIAGDSSDRDVEQAIEVAGRVREKAERLRSMGPSSDAGKTMADRYPDFAERNAEEPKRTFTQHEEWLRAGERQRDEARRFSDSHGRWSEVRSELHDGAIETFDVMRRAWDDAAKECTDLVKGRDSTLVKEAIHALSSSDSGRKQLLVSMTATVGEISTTIGKLAASTSDELTTARSFLDRVRTDLAILEKSKGKSADVQKTYDIWRKATDELPAAFDALAKVKSFQYRADKAPERCAKAVQDRGQRLAKSHRGAGREAIAFADELGKALTEALTKAEGGKREIEDTRNTIRFSHTDPPWNVVTTQLATAGDTMVKHYADALTIARSSWEDVAKGAQSERFLDKLKGQCTKSEMKELDQPVNVECHQGKRTCNKDDEPRLECDELHARLAKNQRCLAARKDIKEWCQASDAGHDAKIAEENKAVETCERRIAAECR